MTIDMGFFFQCYLSRPIGWFRFFGKGIRYKNLRHYPALFSERYGYVKVLKIGDWQFKLI